MTRLKNIFLIIFIITTFCSCGKKPAFVRIIEDFDENWQFNLAIDTLGNIDESNWRTLNLPHDWSIEGEFSENNPATVGGGALPGGIGWYKKTFTIAADDSNKIISILFDGVYRNSEVYINDHFLGNRPYGYISFQYDLTPYLKYGNEENEIKVKVDNSQQPNSRWYSGSGIYRNVWLIKTNKIHVDLWGTFVQTPQVTKEKSQVLIGTKIKNTTTDNVQVEIITSILNTEGEKITEITNELSIEAGTTNEIAQSLEVASPILWSVDDPYLYNALTEIKLGGKIIDTHETKFGIRSFRFDVDKGFILNGEQIKINGVCNHHDLGCLGAAVNTRAIERQLEILKEMGCNGIRTSHNPPAPELLDLCDKMGFIVMDEAYDMWKKEKTKYDNALYWDEWYKKDLQDLVIRDRNHPSIFVWSIGNEIPEQWDSTGIKWGKELTDIVKDLDTTHPVTAACNPPRPTNNLILSGALDLIGYNYKLSDYEIFHDIFPGKKFIATETVSGLMSRGHYDMPSDSIRRWPERWDKIFLDGNPDNTVSAYDNVSAPWGSTHEETWKVIKKHDYLSGQYIWTGFDYLGEPTPYGWPSRSSYFGIIDLAGFPKDIYYMYQSEWTDKDVLYIYPHWNWKEGQIIDVIAYTNFEEIELFLNDRSLGKKSKQGDDLHIMWRVQYEPGIVKAVGKSGKKVMETIVKTADKPAKIILTADRSIIKADGKDLSYITVDIIDKDGIIVPYADNLVNFSIEGNAKIVGVDNGDQVSHESFKTNYRKAYHGKCLLVIQSEKIPGDVVIKASSNGLESASTIINLK